MKHLHEILLTLEDPRRDSILIFHQDHAKLIYKARGSQHNHQAWQGGYADHIAETMRIAAKLYKSLEEYRALNFPLPSALIVLYFHDIEKLYEGHARKTFDKEQFYRQGLKNDYDIDFTPNELNALQFIHGEGELYSPLERVMTPLAAFCHTVDTISARIWFNNGYNSA
jgi:hypothetical protein